MMVGFQVYRRRVKLAFRPNAVRAIGLFAALVQMSGLQLCQARADEVPRPQSQSGPSTNSTDRKDELNSQFEKGLDAVNGFLPPRIISGLEISVTGIIKPFMPEIRTLREAIEFLELLKLKPLQWTSVVVHTYAYVDYERLRSNNRRRFRKGDRLVLSFTSQDTAPHSNIENFVSSALNEGLF